MNGFLRFASCLSMLLAGLVLAGAAPAAADTMLEKGDTLPLSSYAAHVVDESRGRIYITAGPGDDRLAVTDLTGHPVQTVDGLPGASSMALSADGTSLFVALETHRVVRLDADSLAMEKTYDLPDFQEVADLAWAGGRLWVVGRSCCADDTIFSLDPATGGPSPTDLRGYNPRLTSTTGGHLLVLMPSTEKVSLVDTGSGVVSATRGFVDRVAGLGTSSTGLPYVLTYGSSSFSDRLVLLDPDTLETVRSTQVTSLAAIDTDGTIVTSSTRPGWDASGVDVREADTSTTLNRFRVASVPGEEYPVVLATALTSAGLVVIHREAQSVAASLVTDPSVVSTTLSVDPSSLDGFVGRETTLTGTLTDRGNPIAGAQVHIEDEPGATDSGQPVRTRVVTTAEDGTFSFPYTPRSWNDIITFDYAGDEVHPAAWQQVYGDFSLQPTNLSLDYPTTPAPSEPITFSGTLTALGEPLQGAEIEVDQDCTSDLPITVRTDETGRFDLTVTPGRCRDNRFSFFYQNTATYEGRWTYALVQPTWQTSTTTLVQPVEDAVVGSTFVWTGTVTRGGSAAPDVPVTYTITRDSTGSTVAAGTTRTDASGEFRIAETIGQADRYTLIARYAGDATTLGSGANDQFWVTRIPTRISVDDADIEALPDQAVTISGRVTTAEGSALADHPIEIWHDGSVIAPLRTDADGRFEFRTVPRPPASWSDDDRYYGIDVVQDARYAEMHASVHVTVAPEPTRVVLDNVPTKSVPGDEISLGGRLITGEGEPLPGRAVVMTHRDGDERAFHVVTDELGRFSVDTVIRTGRWQYLTASFAGTRVLAASSSSVSWEGAPLPGVLTLEEVPTRLLGESISIKGRLTDTQGNGETSWITIRRINETGQTEWTYEPVQTAADGSFSLPVSAEAVGRYTYAARSDIWRVAPQSASIVVQVRRLQLTTTALRPDAVRRDWSVYEAGRDPLLRTSTNPARGGLCVAHEVERLISGTWRPVTTPECKDTNSAGTVRQSIDVRHPAGSRFRVRAVQDSATRTLGDWVKVRFR